MIVKSDARREEYLIREDGSGHQLPSERTCGVRMKSQFSDSKFSIAKSFCSHGYCYFCLDPMDRKLREVKISPNFYVASWRELYVPIMSRQLGVI